MPQFSPGRKPSFHSSYSYPQQERRNPERSDANPNKYDRDLIKVEERHRPNGEGRASCRQMEFRDGGELVERENVDPIDLEDEASPYRLRRRELGDEPLCACEWITRLEQGG
jgi:hypothetical protein